jgi:ABC-type branched-subunit amino acid transport system substrate-binding protein
MALFGRGPTDAAAQGYNAARRIDHAIRAAGDLETRAAIRAALAETEGGMDW